MKVLQINTVYARGSTGKIALDIHNICKENGIECLSAHRYAEGEIFEDTIEVSSWLDCHIHNRLVRYTGMQGCYSKFKTFTFLKKVKKYNPDVIHLHNLHGSFINLKKLFGYIKKNNIRVIWTLHDCWTFTGICPHFVTENCDKWKTGCSKCPIKKYKLSSDPSKKMHHLKKKWFLGVNDMTFVTTSIWIRDLFKQSFLKDYPTVVINNGINLNLFKPTYGDFREKYNLGNKKVVLGVASVWEKNKGIYDFIKLSKLLDDTYKIVLVGLSKEQLSQIPENMIGITRTSDANELAEIYTAADVFVNPTYCDTFPTVNLEAQACGTPVVTYRTGGSPECIDSNTGVVVECGDIDALKNEIIRVCEEKPFTSENCIKRAKLFDKKERFKEYIKLYEDCTYRP